MTDQLERAITRFVDAAMTGDQDAARLAFADCQAHGLATIREHAELWATVEHRAAAALPDDLDQQDGERALRRLNRETA